MRAAVAALGLCFLLAPSLAHAAPKLVVVFNGTKGAPNIKAQVSSLLEKPLRKNASILPFASYQKAAKAAGIRPKAVTGHEAAVPAGRGAGATHVLIVTSLQDRDPADPKRKRRIGFASVSLVEVATGESLLSKRYALSGKKLDSSTAELILADIVPRLAGPKPTPAPAPEYVPPPPPAPPPLEPLAPPGPPPDMPHEQPGMVVAPDAVPRPAETPPVAPAPTRSESWRPGLRLALGAVAFTRTAKIAASNAAVPPPCYCEPAGASPPVFGRYGIDLALFPLAFNGNGRWWEGFGVHGEAMVGQLRTSLGGGEVTTSTVGGASGGLSYRWVMWDSLTAGDLHVKLGYALFSFPLQGAQFPGTGYRSLYAGADLTFPIIDVLALFVGGHYQFRVVGYGGTAALGSQSEVGTAYRAHGGIRLTFLNMLDIKLLGHIDQYTVPFTGSTRFTAVNYRNVTLTDRMLGGTLMVGVAL